MSALIAFLVAVNPPAVVATLPRSMTMRSALTSALLALGLATLAAGCSQAVLDLLDVSAPTFRVAAGAVLVVSSIRWVAAGATPIADDDPRPLHLLPLFLTPQLVAVAIAVGVDDGVAIAALSGAVALLAAVVAARWRGLRIVWWSWAARLVGVAGVAVGLALVVDGVKTV